MSGSVELCPFGQTEGSALIPIEQAAAQLGIEPKRLRGFIFRNKVGDPIGDANYVYEWSLESLKKRLASASAVVNP